jgi:ribosomal protein S27AE
MTPHTAVPLSYAHERYLGRPSCPKCGVLIMAPESSRYAKGGAIRHMWSCDGCVYEFETLIDFSAN